MSFADYIKEHNEECLWCSKFMDIQSVTINHEAKAVCVKYICENTQCERITRYGVKADYGVQYGGHYNMYTEELKHEKNIQGIEDSLKLPIDVID